VVGFVTITPSRDEDAPAAGEIQALYVDPSRWRGGVGRLLLREACTRLRRRGFEEAILWVLAGNQRGEHFYEAHGWRRDGAARWEQPYDVRSRVIRYRRTLTAGR
jgi:GNAT superfamily N-acetyltransferase